MNNMNGQYWPDVEQESHVNRVLNSQH